MNGINTARYDELIRIESLNPEQLAAVRKMRYRANRMKVSVYTLGALCARSQALDKLSDARNLRKLSPATRETIIGEIEDLVRPYVPAVVAVWSHWCDSNGVDPEARHKPEPQEIVGEALVPMNIPRRAKRRWMKGARAAAMDDLRALLADGPRPSNALTKTLINRGYSRGTVRNAARDLGIPVGDGQGRVTEWSLPAPAPVEEPVEHDENESVIRAMDLPLTKHYGSKWEQAAYAAEWRVLQIAQEQRVAVTTLCRWTEMQHHAPGRPLVGHTVLPDRESDEGIYLAERVFLACGNFSPLAVADRYIRRQRTT